MKKYFIEDEVNFQCQYCACKISATEGLRDKKMSCPQCGRKLRVPNPTFDNRTRIGAWIVIGFIGKGGMAEVYRVVGPGNREAALKILHQDLEDGEEKDYFVEEISKLATLNHSNTLKVYDSGRLGRCPYVVTELIQGHSLEDLLKQTSRLDLFEALRIARDIALALEYSWQNFGIVHRDIKPDNIMVTSKGRCILLDFGVAVNAKQIAVEEHAVGTPAYMSMEQIAHPDEVDFRSDIYNLGVTLFEMLSGEIPYDGDDDCYSFYKAQQEEPVKDIQILQPRLPDAVVQLMNSMLAVEQDQRPSSWRVVIDSFSKFMERYPVEYREAKVKPLDDREFCWSLYRQVVIFTLLIVLFLYAIILLV